MKKTITFPSLRRCWLPVLLTLFYSLNLNAQCNLVCNDHINASMPVDRCERSFTYLDFLQNPTGGCAYIVKLSYPYGTNKLNGDNVDRSHVGYTFVYRVTDSATNNSCWGFITVEDKAGPQPLCKNTKVSCFQVARLTEIVGEVIDNCGQLGSAAIEKLTWADFGCTDPRGLGSVIRDVRTWDEWGNSATCTDTLLIGRDSLTKTIPPDQIALGCRINCRLPGGGYELLQFSSNKSSPNYPTPELLLKLQTGDTAVFNNKRCIDPLLKIVPYIRDSVLVVLGDTCYLVDSLVPMYPAPGGFCKTSLTWTDQVIPVCGTGFKIRREWLIADWCAHRDTTYIQYIKIEDKEAPIVLSTSTLYYNVYVGPHDCFADVTLKALNIDDCDANTKQSYIVTYDLGGHGGKVNILSGYLPATIKLPAIVASKENELKHRVAVTIADACFNRTDTAIRVKVSDVTPPNPICDEKTVTTVDPATCWARVYAQDLDNGSRDNCCNILHFAVATMADIDKARKDWIAYWDANCKADYWNYKTEDKADSYSYYYDGFLEQWINCFVFKDYIDLKDCGDNLVVLRVYEACGVPLYDPHVFPCSEHEWFTYNTFELCRAWHNYTFFHTSGAHKCDAVLPTQCRTTYQTWFSNIDGNNSLVNKLPGGKNKLLAPFYPGAITYFSFLYDRCRFFFPRTLTNSSIPVAPGNTCSARLYNDCMVNVHVDDKTPPVCQEPYDKYAFCDGVLGNNYWKNEYAGGEYGACSDYTYGSENYKDLTCRDQYGNPYNQIECDVENNTTDDIKDPTGKEYGWYGCSIYGAPHSPSDHGPVVDPCETKDSWTPIYCHTWLCLDSKDHEGKFDPNTLFDIAVARQGNPGDTSAGSGKFFIWDNCVIPTIKTETESKVDNCGAGWLKRTWTASDKCDNKIICDQKIYLKHRSDFEVEFPKDVRTTCGNNNTDPTVTGRPIVMDDECELVGVNYEDVRYDIVPDACYKIVRTWTLIDWCKYDPNQHYRKPEVIVDDRKIADEENRYCVYRHLKDDGDGYISYIQIIKIIDTVAPVIVKCKDDTLCIIAGYDGHGAEPAGANCTVPSYKSPDFQATDNCSAPNQITFRWELDLGDNGTIDRVSTPNVNVKNFESSELTVGKHKLWVIALDNCGQADTDFCYITVRDCKKPTPYCYNGIATVLMPTSKEITVWANDLNAGSYDNCTKKDHLTYSFDAAGNELSHVYTCADILGGVSSTVNVTIYVWDEAGNSDFCSTYLLIQDGNGNVCPDNAASVAAITGKITNENKEAVEKVSLDLKSSIKMPAFLTDVNGGYAFKGLPIKDNYTITPQRNDDPMNGVSTIDLVLIQKHILGVASLNSAYKLIAADVDKNKDITVLDLVELRRLILGVYEKFPSNTSWRFVPKSFDFTNISAPLQSNFPERLDINPLSQDELNKDFIGIKVGDVNATSAPHSLLGAEAREADGVLKFRTMDKTLKAGEEALIEISADNFTHIEGYQFSVNIPGLTITDIKPGALKVNATNFGMTKLNQGYFTTSWNDISKSGASTSINKGEILFTIKVKAAKDLTLSEQIRFNSRFTRAEAYSADNSRTKLLNVSLEFGNSSVTKGNYTLYQNTPNPFKTSTMIGFELPKNEKVTINITDVTGKTLRSYSIDGLKGTNNLVINRSELNGAGVLYYTLQSKAYTDTKKMLLIE